MRRQCVSIMARSALIDGLVDGLAPRRAANRSGVAMRILNDRMDVARGGLSSLPAALPRRLHAPLLPFGVVLAGVVTASVARADCTPASANNVTAVCSGTTLNQGGGAPGTS